MAPTSIRAQRKRCAALLRISSGGLATLLSRSAQVSGAIADYLLVASSAIQASTLALAGDEPGVGSPGAWIR